MDTEDNKQAIFYFKNPTKNRSNGIISIEAKNFKYSYPLINQIHNQVLDIVRNPTTGEGINGFERIGFSGRLASQGLEKYTKIGLTQEEIDGFKDYIYSLSSASTFIDPQNKDMVKDLIENLSAEIESMTTRGGKRTKRRRRKGKSKKRRASRRR